MCQTDEMEMPSISNLAAAENDWSADLVFDSSARYFQGHFDGFPVLAGVVQLGVARRLVERWVGRAMELSSVKRLKFSRVVRPGETVRLALSKKKDSEFSFEYSKGGLPCASGVLCF